MIDTCEGRSNSYLIQGLMLLALVIILSATSAFVSVFMLIPAAAVFIFAIMVFGVKTGLQIDPELMQYRSYGKIGSYVFGSWIPFAHIESALLQHSSEDIYRPGMVTVSLRGTGQSTVVTTFDIVLIDINSKRKTIFEFGEYKHANKTLKEIHAKMDIPVTNKVAKKMAENKRNRR